MATGFRTSHVISAIGRRGHRVVILNLTGKPSASRPGDIVDFHTHDQSQGRIALLFHRLLEPDYPHSGRVSEALALLRARDIVPAAVYCGTPPHSAQAIASGLAAALRVPYLADLRDDWAGNHRRRYLTPLHRLHSSRSEARAVTAADCVVLNTPIVHERFARAYPDHARKFVTITNGFDDALDGWRGIASPSPGLVIAYAGSPYWGFMEARIRELHASLRRTGLRDSFRIETMGDAWGIQPGASPLEGWTHHGQLGEDAMARRLADAHVLLLAMPPGEREPSPTVPLKTYGYLRLGKSVVYVGESGATTSLIGAFPGTWHFPRDQWPHLAEWMACNEQELRRAWNRPGTENYRMSALADKVVDRIEALVAARRLS